MNSDFTRIISSGGRSVYTKVNSSGAVIVVPNEGSVILSAIDIKKILDYMKSFDYTEQLINRSLKRVVNSTTMSYNVLNENTNELILVDFSLSTSANNPVIKFRSVNVDSAKVVSDITLPYDVVQVLLYEFRLNGFTSSLADIKQILYVDKLPNETAAKSDTVYYYNKKWYKLNADEDELVEITGPFEQVKKLYEFTTQAKENVLYNLTAPYTNEYGERFEKGIYTYTKTGNKHTFTDLKLQYVKRLPAVADAQENVIYILTKDDMENNKAKDSRWTVDNDTFKEEKREIVSLPKLPFIRLAVNGTYYILNEEYVKLAKNDSYETVGKIEVVTELPDVTTIALEPGIVYVLNRKQGTRAAGTKWVFDFEEKEFVEFSDEVEYEEESANTETDNTDNQQQNSDNNQQQNQNAEPQNSGTGTDPQGD